MLGKINDIIAPYPGILLDAYGVFWGGNHFGLLKGAAARMADFVHQGKIVGILSNSTQLSEKEITKVAKQGLIQGTHFHFFITSGSATKQLLTHGTLPFKTPSKKYCLLGAINPHYLSHIDIFKDSPYIETKNIEEADFLYTMVPHIQGFDQTDPTLFVQDIEPLMKYALPLICPNPDRFSQEGNPPEPMVRQGSIAAIYESLGGTVFYIGKPHPLIYTEVMGQFAKYNITNAKHLLMIGDTPETDIRGANKQGMDSVLITQTGMAAFLNSTAPFDQPTFFIEQLG